MGRRRKGWKPTITPENKALADEYINYMATVYNDYIDLFGGMFKEAASDIAAETILKTYNSIAINGMRNLSEEPEKRSQMFRNYFFISAKLNYLTYCQDDRKRKYTFIPGGKLADEVYTPPDSKIKRQIYNDYRVMYLLDMVENEFDDVSYRCFRLYHLIKGNTYAKLKKLTGISNCKLRVVTVNKWLRENVDENEIRRRFVEQFPDLE